jgi:hypothetical protein
MRKLPLVAVIAALVAGTALAGGPEHDGHARHDHGDVSKVNRSISIDDGETAGEVETVNGSISIGANTVIASAETVNGSVRVGANAQAGSLSTVNGGINVGAKTVVRRWHRDGERRHRTR